MNSIIELQQQLTTLLTELIDQERVTANHVRITGHITDADKNNTARIRYQCLELIQKAFDQGQQSYSEAMLRYGAPVRITQIIAQEFEHDKVQKNMKEPQLFQ